MIKAVAFDLDGTLLNRSESIRHYCDFFVFEHLDWFVDGFDTFAATGRLFDIYRGGLSKTPAFYADIIDQFHWKKRPDPEYLDTHYREHMINLCIPQENVYTTLQALKSMGITFGIVTNGVAEHQRRKIERLRLDKLVDTILISGELGIGKPNPRIFEAFCNAKKVMPGETLFVGDDALRDIKGAGSFNMLTAWYRDGRLWKHTEHEPDIIIDDLIESVDYIRHLREPGLRHQPLTTTARS